MKRPHIIIADSDLAADRLPHPAADILRLSAVAVTLAIASVAIGVGLFIASLPADEPPFSVHYIAADQGGS